MTCAFFNARIQEPDMTDAAEIKDNLEKVDKSNLSQTVDQSIAARLGKPADEEE